MFDLEKKIIQVTKQWNIHRSDNYNLMFPQKTPFEKAI